MSALTPAHAGQAPPPAADRHGPRLPRVVVASGFVILALSYMVNAMDRQVFFPILPAIRAEYGFSLPEGGMLATGFTLGMAVSGLPAGYLIGRLSRKSVLLVSIVLYSLGTLATPLAGGFGDMMTYRIVSGVGEGMQSAALFAAVGTYFFHRRALALGGIGAAFGLGIFLGPLVGIHLDEAYHSWRAPFVLFGSCGLTIAVVALFVVSRRMTELVHDPVASTATYDHVPACPYNRNTLTLTVSAALGGLAVYGFLGLYPTYLISAEHYTTGQAALAASFVGFGGLTALLAGWLGDRVDQRNLLVVTYLALAATSLLVYRTDVSPGTQDLYAFLMGAFGTGSLYPNTSSAMQRAVRPDRVGTAAGLFITGYYLSSAFSGLLFATFVDHLGWRQAGLWQVTVLSLVAAGVLTGVRGSQFITATPPVR
jgi:MFS family permease